MKRWMRKLAWTACLATFWIGAARSSETPGMTAGTTVVIREAGKPDRTCIIEKLTHHTDGGVVHHILDAITGERFSIYDGRKAKGSVSQAAYRITEVLSTPRCPTTAELAGGTSGESTAPQPVELLPVAPAKVESSSPDAKPSKPIMQTSAIDQPTLDELIARVGKGPTAAARDSAATTLAQGESRTKPEVVAALVAAATLEPVASVRVTLVRCLYAIGATTPEVLSALDKLQHDADPEVRVTAWTAYQRLNSKK